MADIVSIAKTPVQHDIVAGLRRLADNIEAGTVDEMPVITTCVCVIGHSDNKLLEDGDIARSITWDRYVWGPRGDAFTVAGLMAFTTPAR